MNWIDYVILGILFLSTMMGMARGLIKELLSLLFLIVAFLIAMKYSEALAAYFNQTSILQDVGKKTADANIDAAQPVSYIVLCVSFLILFLGTILIGAFVNFFINILFQTGLVGFGNRLLGFLFGFCRGIIINLVIIFVLQFSTVVEEEAWHQSRLLPFFEPWVIKLNAIVSPKLDEFKTKLQQTIQLSQSKRIKWINNE